MKHGVVFGYAGGRRVGGRLALGANLGSNFKRFYLRNGKKSCTLYLLNRVRAIDWDRFQSSSTTYKRDSGSWSGFGPWTTGKGWK